MGIFTRVRDILNSNINSALDKAEDPEKLVRQMIREMEEAVNKATASVGTAVANHKRLERQHNIIVPKIGHAQRTLHEDLKLHQAETVKLVPHCPRLVGQRRPIDGHDAHQAAGHYAEQEEGPTKYLNYAGHSSSKTLFRRYRYRHQGSMARPNTTTLHGIAEIGLQDGQLSANFRAAARQGFRGEVAEWLKAHAWKACMRVTVSWVRIPLSPPPSLGFCRLPICFPANPRFSRASAPGSAGGDCLRVAVTPELPGRSPFGDFLVRFPC